MAHLDHQKGYDEFKERVLEGIKQHFPLEGKQQRLELESLDVADAGYDPDAIRDQHLAKVNGTTWAAPIYGNFLLKDTKTGDTIDKRRMRLADLPLITRRYSHIIDGKEYQVNNQWQLKPGIYTKRRANGGLEAAFNIPRQHSFDVTFSPENKLFLMERGGSKIPVYPLLKQLGVDDDALEHSWGKEVFAANKTAKGADTAVNRFFRVDKKRQPKDAEEAQKYLIDAMAASALRPDATELTLGKKFQNVTGEAIHMATNKLLKVQSGAPEDDRDSILFKDLRGVGDFAYDYLSHYETKKSIRAKITRKMFSAHDVRDLIKFDMFNDPVRRTFHENSEAELAKQINPVEMLGLAQQTTVLGPGGIQSQNAFDNMTNAKFVNPSTLGFLDPVRTPENEKSGGILRMPMGVQKHGKEPALQLYNLKTHKIDLVTPVQFHNSTVVLPDQARWKDGKPTPISNKVKASSLDDTMKEVHWKDADYVMRHPSQLFSATTNLIPFLGNNSGNRATYAGQHIEQAISLKHRVAPLVQVATPSTKKGEATFEELIGGFAAHVSPVAGTVTAVKKDGILVKQHDGKEHEIQLYNNFPLNDPKAMLHSTPLVKVGDKIAVGQTVADSNYTKNGALALGTNVRVAYIPYKGLNFEDGLVISKSAATKFTSEHLHKPETSLEKDTILDPKKFIVLHPDAFNQAQYKKLDDTGVVRVGQKVKTGDPLVLSMRPYQAKDRMSLQAIGRALSGRHVDTTLRWSSDHEGEVVGVHRDKDKVVVHVSTAEPMQVGDKISNRHGGKGICVAIIEDDKMPKTKDGQHIEVAFNPTSVPGRMNLGQILETAASKVAEKTGKPFIVHNFSNEPQLARVKAELKKHGLTDQEELTDPETGMVLGKALVGPQHMFKLVHQIDKKESARSGMATPGSEPEAYDSNLMPASGGHTGGQSLGALDMYVLLAHGAKATLREVQTIKSEGPDPNPNPAKQWPSQHHDVWNAIQQGEPIPAPKSTFAWQKFTDMLKATGVDVQKKGHILQLVPLTDAQILKMSHGEIKKPGEVVYPSLDKNGEPRPKAGGILDEKITGGHGGKSWSHIALAEPVPNPVFERAIQKITGLTEDSYMSIVNGHKAVNHAGALVELGTTNAVTGGPGVVRLLERIDVDKELKTTEAKLSAIAIPKNFAHRATVPNIDKLVKKVKYLRALKEAGLKPTEAYVLHNLPVIPPIMRPISMLKDGSVKWGDLNELYKGFGAINTAMKDPSQAKLEDDQRQDLRQSLYEGVRAIVGLGTGKDLKHKGILQQIAGKPAKEGYFQDTLMARRQDMSMRSTIVPNPSLGLDEVGLPREKALTLYKPFVVRKLVEMGAAEHALEARKLIQDNDPSINRALDLVALERPVLLKRDPALHRHSIQGFRPKIVTGKAIQIHPLVTSGFSADFDGDQQLGSVFLWVSSEILQQITGVLGDKPGEVGVNCQSTRWWDYRKASSEMTARLTERVGYFADGSFYICNLEDFPHLDDHITKGHIDFHAVPAGLKVIALEESTGRLVLADVAGWSKHHDRKVEIVTLRSGRQIVTDDDERAVYGLNGDLAYVRKRPAEAAGLFVPVSHTLDLCHGEQQQLQLPLGDKRLRSTVALDGAFGRLCGTLAGDGWVSFNAGILKGQVCLANVDDGVTKGFATDLMSVFKESPTLTFTGRVGGDFGDEVVSERYVVSSMLFSKLMLPLIGEGAQNKHLPPFFLQAPRNFRLGLLAGLIDTDGSISTSHAKGKPQWMCSFSSSSMRLVQEVNHLAKSLAVRSTITDSKTPAGEPYWMLSFSTVDLHALQELPLAHVEKRRRVTEFFASPPPMKKNSYAQIDIIPTPYSLARVLRDFIGTRFGRAVYINLTHAFDAGYMSRFAAEAVVTLLPSELIESLPVLQRWVSLIGNTAVWWDKVATYETSDHTETGFDLTVPGFETFMSVDGIVLSNTMSVYVPISAQAVEEAKKMMPSQNLYNEASGRVTYTPTLESALGLYKMSRVTNNGTHKFASAVDAIKAVNAKKLTINDLATIDGTHTTVGRVLLSNALPEEMQHEYLTQHDKLIDKKGLDRLFTTIAKNHRDQYGEVANKLKDLGNGTSSGAIPIFSGLKGPALIKASETKGLQYVSTPVHSLSLEDFAPDTHTRDRVLGAAQREVNAIDASTSFTAKDKERRAVDVWVAASNKMDVEHLRHTEKNPSNLALMLRAGVKPSMSQYKQMVLAPVLMADATGKPISIPITSSYSEGLDVASYWTQQQGARRGTVMKVQEVREPGTLSKRMVQTTMGLVVAQDDCGTHRGISLPVSSRDIQDRVLVNDAIIKDVHVSAGTQLTPALVDQLRAADKSANLIVRSPLKCEHAKGLCGKCAGLRSDGTPYVLGTNVGILAAQALGERSVQLTMKAFHSGGVVQSNAGSRAVDDFARVEQLMQLTESIPHESTLAMRTGKIERVEKDRTGVEVWIGGVKHHVGKDPSGMALHEDLPNASKAPGYTPWQPPKVGMHVEAGTTLSDPNRTVVNPRDLYRATNNMERVQNYLVDELHRVYGSDVRRQHVETLVHAMGNLTKIRHPGDAETVLIGEFRPVNQVRAMNRDLIKAGKQPIEHSPVLKGVDAMPLEVQEDWLAKLQHIKIRGTLLEAASVGARSDLHGLHPVPALAVGNEFGLNSSNSKQPGLGHLKDVPTFNY